MPAEQNWWASGLRYRRSSNRASAGLHADNGTLRRPHQMRPQLGDSAGRRSATNREQRCAALGAVALPAGTTVGQSHLPRIGDRDLLAADTSALWAGLRRLWMPYARFSHGHQHIPGRLAFSRALPINLGGLAAGASAGEARRCIGSVARDCPSSCHETVTCVQPPHRTRSQSRISSLAAIARRIADDRALKAPGQPSCSVARVLAMPGGFPRPRFTMSVNTMMIAPIRVMTNGLCRRSRRAKRAIVSADRRGSSSTPRLRSTGRAAGRGRPVDVVAMIRKAGPRTLVDGGRGRFTFWRARSRGWSRRRGR